MPRRRSTWSSWNYVADHSAGARGSASPVSVTYWVNRLQNRPTDTSLFVSVNPGRAPLPAATHARFAFEHPMHTTPTPSTRSVGCMPSRVRAIHTFAAATAATASTKTPLSAGLDVAEQLGVRRPWPRPAEHRRIGAPPRVLARPSPIAPAPLPVAARVATDPS